MTLSFQSKQPPSGTPGPGERLATYFETFFTTVVAVTTLGASLTFSRIVSAPVDPWQYHGISSTSIQNYMAISWLLFILDLVITAFAASALSLWRPKAIKLFGTSDSQDRRTVMWYATFVSMVLFGLLIMAFLFLALVVVAYTGPTGWAAVAFTVFFGIMGFGAIIWQSPIGSKSIGGPPANDPLTHHHQHHHHTDYPPWDGDRDDDLFGGFRPGDEYRLGTEMGEKGRYTGDGLSRMGTVRRGSDSVPPYTAERRRSRASRRGHRPDDSKYEPKSGNWEASPEVIVAPTATYEELRYYEEKVPAVKVESDRNEEYENYPSTPSNTGRYKYTPRT
ncbi:hypothetical protein B7494_g5702 [Chlorociboria aeruginascens]|nr:hypothetical protein B7494_g5702 [Chlorociboria aeruginascens]